MWAITSINQKLIRLAKKIPEQEKQEPESEVSSRLGWEEPGEKKNSLSEPHFQCWQLNFNPFYKARK